MRRANSLYDNPITLCGELIGEFMETEPGKTPWWTEAPASGEVAAIVEECRARIAAACGTEAAKVRIMIEV